MTDLPELPHNFEAEQALLGAILVNNQAYHQVADFLHAEHFADPLHGQLYDALAKLLGRGQLVNAITLKAYVEQNQSLREAGGVKYLASMASASVHVLDAAGMAKVITDAAARRRIIQLAEQARTAAYKPEAGDTAAEQLERLERALYDVASDQTEGGFQSSTQVLTKTLRTAEAAHQRTGKLAGISTGFASLDRLLGGLHKSDLIILAGRPSMGKTALATNIAYNVAAVDGAKVGFFSLEMSAEQLATRIFSEQTGIPSNKMRRGSIDQVDYDQIARTCVEIQNLPLFIDECGGLSIGQIAARARRLKRTYGLDLVVIDYLQLACGTTRRSSENRVAEITEITTRLKALAKELNVPVLALSQLSRAVESRDDKRPQLTDLRDSGSIEQDADVVLFVHRDEYYLQMKKPPMNDPAAMAEWLEKSQGVIGKAELIIGKQRHGPIGTINLQFSAEVTRFANLAEQ